LYLFPNVTTCEIEDAGEGAIVDADDEFENVPE
jgi:hypothetical protein